MNWKKYAVALLATNGVMILLGYIILRIQSMPLFNPNGIGNMEESLSFNTIISFMTNTNLQHYSGESGLSYLSQMLVITFMMFVSAASGYAACVAFIRGLAGKTKDNVGNFLPTWSGSPPGYCCPSLLSAGFCWCGRACPRTSAATWWWIPWKGPSRSSPWGRWPRWKSLSTLEPMAAAS